METGLNTNTNNTIQSIQCGLSQAFHNKENRTGSKTAFGQSFQPRTVTTAEFVAHITSGKAWTQGFFKDNSRRKTHFVSAQTLALDLDDHVSVQDVLAEPLIAAHALLVHPSPSSTPDHPKTRVIFVLSEAVTDMTGWEQLQRGALARFAHLRPDPACKDAARLFYGSTVDGAHVNLAAVLPLAVAQAWGMENISGGRDTVSPLHTHNTPNNNTTPTPNTATGTDSDVTTVGAIATVARRDAPPSPYANGGRAREGGETTQFTPPPTPSPLRKEGGTSVFDAPPQLAAELIAEVEQRLGVRHMGTNGEGFTLQAVPCPLKAHEHDDTAPAFYWHPTKHFGHCFKCGADYNTHEIAAAFGIDPSHYYASATQHLSFMEQAQLEVEDPAPFNPQYRVNLRYISEFDPDEIVKRQAVLLKSPIGTGKTQLAAQAIARLGEILKRSPRVLALTHRQALADDLATRLAASGHIFECYKGLEASDLRRISRLVICYDSVWKLARVDDTLPEYDLIIIDEIEQFHQHLGGETMKGGSAERAYRTLRALIQQTPRFLGMDAHLSETTQKWLDKLRQKQAQRVLSVQNIYQHEKGTLTLHERSETAIRTAQEMLAENNGVVVIATNSRRKAKELGKLFESTLRPEEIRVIHGDNSNNQDVQQFIRQINQEITKLRLLIYSPSLGTGVDITAPVRGVVGIFTRQPLAPTDMLQMLGRCRHAQERHAWVSSAANSLETDWKAIYQGHRSAALYTGLVCDFTAKGNVKLNPIQEEILLLLANLEAQRNHTMNTMLPFFVHYAQQEGYTVDFREGEAEATREAMQAAAKAVKAAEKASVLAATPVDHQEMERHQTRGTVTPEIAAGYERFKIEDCAGQTITEALYDDLHTSQKRQRLRRFTDMTEKADDDLKVFDREEDERGVLLQKRQHRTVTRKLIRQILVEVWGAHLAGRTLLETAAQTPLTADEIGAALSGYIAQNSDHLRHYLGWRNDQSRKPVALLRWILSRVGLRLAGRQVMAAGERFYVYVLEVETVTRMTAYAASRRAHLERKRRLEAEQNAYLTPDYLNRGEYNIPPRLEEYMQLRF